MPASTSLPAMGLSHLESAMATRQECQQEWNVAIRNIWQVILSDTDKWKIAINPTKEFELRTRCWGDIVGTRWITERAQIPSSFCSLNAKFIWTSLSLYLVFLCLKSSFSEFQVPQPHWPGHPWRRDFCTNQCFHLHIQLYLMAPNCLKQAYERREGKGWKGKGSGEKEITKHSKKEGNL